MLFNVHRWRDMSRAGKESGVDDDVYTPPSWPGNLTQAQCTANKIPVHGAVRHQGRSTSVYRVRGTPGHERRWAEPQDKIGRLERGGCASHRGPLSPSCRTRRDFSPRRVIVEADVGKFEREPRSFPKRKGDDLVAEREVKGAMGGRKTER